MNTIATMHECGCYRVTRHLPGGIVDEVVTHCKDCEARIWQRPPQPRPSPLEILRTQIDRH